MAQISDHKSQKQNDINQHQIFQPQQVIISFTCDLPVSVLWKSVQLTSEQRISCQTGNGKKDYYYSTSCFV